MQHADATKGAIHEHLAAFNSHDRSRLLDGLSEQIVWATGQDRRQGRQMVADLFDEWLWNLRPHIDIVQLVAEGEAGAAECVERLTIDGQTVEFPIAVFFSVRDGLLTRVKVFREGSADVASHGQ